MRILVFSAYYSPEIAASIYLTENIFESFAESGNKVDLYVPTPTRGVSDETRREYKKKKSEVCFGGNLTVHRFALYREGKNPLSRAIRYALLNIAFIIKGLFAGKADVIFAQSTPPTMGLCMGILKKLKKIPFVYNLQDVFPDSLVNTGLTQNGSFLFKIGRVLENFSYKNADKIIVISEGFKENIMKKGVPESKIVVVPNWADTKGIAPIERENNILFEKYGIPKDRFIVSYSGNIGHTQNMDMLLDCAASLKDRAEKLLFVLVGDGAEKAHVESRINEENIGNVILLPFQPYSDISHVFSIGDAGLIISKPDIGNNSVPSKTWGIMAAARPVIASFDADNELCSVISEARCGVVCQAGDAGEFTDKLLYLYENKDICLEMGSRGKAYIDEKLNAGINVKKYTDTVTSTAHGSENSRKE